MWQAAGLQLASVAQQRSRSADGRQVPLRHPKAVERRQRERAGQVLARQPGVELPRVSLRARRRPQGCKRAPARENDLRGLIAGECVREVRRGDGLQHQLTGDQIERGNAGVGTARVHRHEKVVAVALQPVVGEHAPGRHRLDYLPAHDPLGELRVLYLLADRHPVAAGHEAS